MNIRYNIIYRNESTARWNKWFAEFVWITSLESRHFPRHVYSRSRISTGVRARLYLKYRRFPIDPPGYLRGWLGDQLGLIRTPDAGDRQGYGQCGLRGQRGAGRFSASKSPLKLAQRLAKPLNGPFCAGKTKGKPSRAPALLCTPREYTRAPLYVSTRVRSLRNISSILFSHYEHGKAPFSQGNRNPLDRYVTSAASQESKSLEWIMWKKKENELEKFRFISDHMGPFIVI